ncbi:MAG: D-sedoheptulose 7-phosphate isomerase [Chromatiaceae bacterium]
MHRIESIIAAHLATIQALREQRPVIERIGNLIIECLQRGGKVCWLGNGGSAANCQHLAAELVGRFERDRRGLASVAFTTDTSALTSIANDYGFEQIFARRVEALCRPRDLVIGLSTSGNSPNVLAAIETARHNDIATAGLSGRAGGKLKDLADACLVVPAENTARIQEAHILVGHILCDLAEAQLSGSETKP